MNLAIDADSISPKSSPLDVADINRLFDSKRNLDKPMVKPIGGDIPAGKAGQLRRPFAASFTMGQSKPKTCGKDVATLVPKSCLFQSCGVEDLEDDQFYEFDETTEVFQMKFPQDDLIVSTDLPMSTASAFHSSAPSSRSRYNFQLGLINTAEMLPESRSHTTTSHSPVAQ